MRPSIKFILDFLPLAGFLIGYKLYDLFVGTAAIMLLTVITLLISWLMERKIPLLPLISGIFVSIMGALTLYLHNDLFIKIRPTLVNLLFAGILLLGAYGWKKGLLKPLFGMAFELSDTGWIVLSKRWGFFFVFLAAANELVWRHFPTDVWVNYKVFGVMAMTFVFTLSQALMMQRYMAEDK